IVEEDGSERAGRLWDAADRVVSVRLVYPQARAALAAARRARRLTESALRRATTDLETVVGQLDIVELSEGLARRAGELAELQGLRGYDAVHLAAAETVADAELVLVAGDTELLGAAGRMGLATGLTR
ncbi:MAG: type II toxin-antitoxin system VapC family toxin, partial [Actinomycetota bacterium]|nr:type II toxin-antitoxin system VapC family toxin [Actinomycetota bacterium]